jgi:hypothetical protein
MCTYILLFRQESFDKIQLLNLAATYTKLPSSKLRGQEKANTHTFCIKATMVKLTTQARQRQSLTAKKSWMRSALTVLMRARWRMAVIFPLISFNFTQSNRSCRCPRLNKPRLACPINTWPWLQREVPTLSSFEAPQHPLIIFLFRAPGSQSFPACCSRLWAARSRPFLSAPTPCSLQSTQASAHTDAFIRTHHQVALVSVEDLKGENPSDVVTGALRRTVRSSNLSIFLFSSLSAACSFFSVVFWFLLLIRIKCLIGL